MKGYDKDEEYTKRVVRDGKYHTGDLGRINERGRLVLLLRNPEIILLPTGEKISRTVTIRRLQRLTEWQKVMLHFTMTSLQR